VAASPGAGAAVRTNFALLDGEVYLEFNGSTLSHRYMPGATIDTNLMIEEMNSNGTSAGVLWALPDHQGTVRDVIDTAGAVQNHIKYTAFGGIHSELDPDVEYRFTYTGREFDSETDLYYYRARYYDAEVGRFISEDPIAFDAGDANLYRYVGNNSGNGTDPWGLAKLAHGGNEGDGVYVQYTGSESSSTVYEYKVGYLVNYYGTWFIRGRNEKGTMTWGSEYISLKDAKEWAAPLYGLDAWPDKWRKFALSSAYGKRLAEHEGKRRWTLANRGYQPDDSWTGRAWAITKNLPAGWYETAASGEQLASLVGGLDGMNDTMLKPLAELGLSVLYQRNVHIEEGGLGNLFGLKDGDGRLARAYGTGNTIGVVTGHIENVGITIVTGKALIDGLRNAPAFFNGGRNLAAVTAGGGQVVLQGGRAAASAKGLVGTAGLLSGAAYNTGHAMAKSGNGGGLKGQRPKNGSTDAAKRASSDYIKKTRAEFEKTGGSRQKYWENEYATNRSAYSRTNQSLLKQGKAPFGTDGKPMVLHHKIPIEYGGTNDFSNLQPMRYTDHALKPNFGPLHTPPFSE